MKRQKQQFKTHRIAAIAVASLMLAVGIASLAERGFAQRIVRAAWRNTSVAFSPAFDASSTKHNGVLALGTAGQKGVVKGATTGDGQVSFQPETLTIPAGQTTATINVTTYANPAASYDLHFTATGSINGTDVTHDYTPIVKLALNAQCSITDKKCLDDTKCNGIISCNPSSCYGDSGQLLCPIQDGCWTDLPKCQDFVVLKVRKDRQCNQWLDCKTPVTVVNSTTGSNQTQCSALGVCVQLGPDGRCSQFLWGTPAGQQVANRIYQTPADVQPVVVSGVESKIRWYSGYSSGFHFFVDLKNPDQRPSISGGLNPTDVTEVGLNGATAADLVSNGTFESLSCLGGPRDRKSCIVASDCRVGSGTCVQFAEGNGHWCRDNHKKTCSTDFDCGGTKGSCQLVNAYVTAGATSNISCTSDSDCQDVKTAINETPVPHCRYLSSWGSDVLCQNPLDGEWLGITPPSSWCSGDHTVSCSADQDCASQSKGTCVSATSPDDVEEAGWGFSASDSTYDGDVRSGTRNAEPDNNGVEAELVKWRIWEDESNFVLQSVQQTMNDPRYPGYAPEKHLKDGNNNLKVTIAAGSDAGTGVGVPLVSKPTTGGNGYILSFRYKYLHGITPPQPVKAQFGFNYQTRTTTPGSTKGYELLKNNAATVDIGRIAGPTVCSQDPATSCDVSNDQCGSQAKGKCVDTSDWQQFTLGPKTIPDTVNIDQSKTPLLQFVSDANATTATTFYLDDVSLKPALEVAQQDTSENGPVLIPRSCRLFARDDAPDCQYTLDDGTTYKGWRGYCLDKDPKNADLCLTWWPLDILAGENPLGSVTQSNYNGPETVYQCLEQPAENGVGDFTGFMSQFDDYFQIEWDPPSGSYSVLSDNGAYGGSKISTSGGYCAVTPNISCITGNDCSWNGPCVHAAPKATIRWRDLIGADVFFDPNAEWSTCANGGVTGGMEDCSDPATRVYHIDLNKINRVAGDNGVRLFVAQTADASTASNVQWNPPQSGDRDQNSSIWRQGSVGDDCDDSNIGSHDDRYFAVLLQYNDLGSPSNPDAIVNKVQVKMCDDAGGSPSSSIRIVLRARSSCNYVAQTVKAIPGSSPDQKAWGPRMQTGAYTDPKLLISYDSDSAPYGAMNAGDLDPKDWPTWSPPAIGETAKGFGGQPSLEETNPQAAYGNFRAGTSYSYDSDPSPISVSTSPKYCFDASVTVSPLSGTLSDDPNIFTFNTQSQNTCNTQDQKTACLTSDSNVCAGRPVKHCNGNQLILCTQETDCSSKGYGSCIGSADAGWSQSVHGVADAVKRLQHVFAQSFGCWQLQTSLVAGGTDFTNNPSDCSNASGCTVSSRYVSGCTLPDHTPLNQDNSRSNGGIWDVTSDHDRNNMPYICPGIPPKRPRVDSNDDAEYCYVTPTVDSFLLGGASSGNITVNPNQSVTAQFSYTVDSQQGPAKQYAIMWERPTTDTSSGCSSGWSSNMPTGFTISLPGHNYTSSGTYKPRLCVMDSWGVVGWRDYSDTITATGS